MCPGTVIFVHSCSINLHVMDNSDIQKTYCFWSPQSYNVRYDVSFRQVTQRFSNSDWDSM